MAEIQLEISDLQVTRTRQLVDAGSLPEGNLLEMQAQAAADELQVINSENQLKASYLTLIQILDLDTIQDFTIERPELPDPDQTRRPGVYLWQHH